MAKFAISAKISVNNSELTVIISLGMPFQSHTLPFVDPQYEGNG
jgi:hypothetical protein